MSWYSHYVLYIIEPKINESIKYLKIFEDVFQKNQKILVFNKIDGINSIDFFNNNSKVQKFIKKNNIKNKFYINSIDTICINDFNTFFEDSSFGLYSFTKNLTKSKKINFDCFVNI